MDRLFKTYILRGSACFWLVLMVACSNSQAQESSTSSKTMASGASVTSVASVVPSSPVPMNAGLSPSPVAYPAESAGTRLPPVPYPVAQTSASLATTAYPAATQAAVAHPPTVTLPIVLSPSGTPVYTYTIVNTYPHDQGAFTEGLVFDNGVLYEGTGLNGQSHLRKVELTTGKVLQDRALPDQFFGEGITIFDNQIFQLTWQSHTGFIYDKNSFDPIKQFAYPTEGWGITHDKTHLIMSDGTSTLYILDPHTLERTGQISVYDTNGPVMRLNELEYVGGEIYANVWMTDRIARIDPQSGRVTGWIDLQGIISPAERRNSDAVLNGIAYDAANNRLFVTGKLWPKLFEIRLVGPR